MLREELATRLNDRGYKNWLKAAQCLVLLKDGLHPFITHRMRAFHGGLLSQNTLLRTPCLTSCRTRGTTLLSPCKGCSEWQTVILRHYRQQEAVTVNWGNCFPPRWRTDYWELAKAFMPRGQKDVKAADQCDASALLNLINCCDCFCHVGVNHVREVIRYRNELMHSCQFRVKDEWMRHYRHSLKNLVLQFSDIPRMAAVGRQIEEMLIVDLSIYVSGLEQTDSAYLQGIQSDTLSQWEISGDLIGQWESDLLQEQLQELLCAAADEDDHRKTQATEQLKRLGGFLQDNRDLAERFSAELQTIDSLEARE